ncbi:acetyltransferase [Yersinia entomophaga]|uniref:Acetyltransferase n=1 Tax=Yersinia entomophaga TaxID=935293 RepID=A0ABN4PUI4_YERET|nr:MULTISPECIES: GNAT family protein [Yersinia]ANI29172.1 acetyltransferase [Yersinia entomophaga]OWF89214.1 N-acetyltransferase [Yersinia entomophaga]
MQLPIKTLRLLLRRFTPDDFPSYQAYHSLASVYRYLYCAPADDATLRANLLQATECRFQEQGDTLTLAVERVDTGEHIGEVLFKLSNKPAAQAEVGYIFNPKFSGQGFATEAVQAMLNIGFTQHGCHRIFARLDALNIGSINVVERLGMRKEAHLIQNDCFNGVWGDELIYAQLKREWLANSARQD